MLGFSAVDAPTESRSANLRMCCFPAGGSRRSPAQVAQPLLDAIEGDVLYACKPKLRSFGVGLWAKLRDRLPLILDVDDWELSWHGGDQWRYRPNPKQLARDVIKSDGGLRQVDHPLYLRWMERLAPNADLVTIHTQLMQRRFGGEYVPNGKDIHLFDPQHHDPVVSRDRHGLHGYRLLMFPGAPRPYKGLEDVLLALELLNEPDLRLVIVGGSPYDNFDEQLMERWGRWIIKLPVTPYEAMPEIISAAHIIVVPQRDVPAAQAQFPLKLTDGMAMAKPILATRVGDVPGILGETGYLVDPSSPEQLAAQIQDIFADYDTALERGRQARQRCVEHYSIEAMGVALARIMKQVRRH
jgi:glycosyltransferase involved in cell wall biosynthesis